MWDTVARQLGFLVAKAMVSTKASCATSLLIGAVDAGGLPGLGVVGAPNLVLYMWASIKAAPRRSIFADDVSPLLGDPRVVGDVLAVMAGDGPHLRLVAGASP